MNNIKYLTHESRKDGFGAQFQTIINTVIFAELNGYEYVYKPFVEMEHNYDSDPDYLQKKEILINFKNNFRDVNSVPEYTILKAIESIRFFETNLNKCIKSDALTKIKNIFRSNKEYKYIHDKIIAVHIRRPNSNDNRLEGANVADSFFIEKIEYLSRIYGDHKIHIYSQGSLDSFKIYTNKGYSVFLNTPIEECFINFVYADVLFTSPSSFSYIAGILSNGHVYYKDFWHVGLPSWNLFNKNLYRYYKSDKYQFEVTDSTLKHTPNTFLTNSVLWETDSIDKFYNLVKQSKNNKINIVDIGAQSGLYTLFAKWLPNAHFYSFEPFKLTYDILNDNIELNGITNVTTHNCALSDKIGTAQLNVCKSHNGLHTLGDNLRFNDSVKIDVKIDTLDNIFYDRDIPVDFIKIDTEGHEYFIIKGGLKTIRKYKPVIQLEWNITNMKQCKITEDDMNKLLNSIDYVKFHKIDEELFIAHKDYFLKEKSKMKEILIKSGLEIDNNDKIILDSKIKSLKIDVGLSYSAPMTQNWLKKAEELGTLDNTFVFGFEPVPENIKRILSIDNKRNDPAHSEPLESKYFKHVCVIPIALGSKNDETDFYLTTKDIGCSSLFKPKDMDFFNKITVPLFRLDVFLEFLDWSKFEYIEYLKCDAQGSDIEIIKGMGDYISKFVLITLEAENGQYIGCENNNIQEMNNLFSSYKFVRIESNSVQDPTYINTTFVNHLKDIYFYQRG